MACGRSSKLSPTGIPARRHQVLGDERIGHPGSSADPSRCRTWPHDEHVACADLRIGRDGTQVVDAIAGDLWLPVPTTVIRGDDGDLHPRGLAIQRPSTAGGNGLEPAFRREAVEGAAIVDRSHSNDVHAPERRSAAISRGHGTAEPGRRGGRPCCDERGDRPRSGPGRQRPEMLPRNP